MDNAVKLNYKVLLVEDNEHDLRSYTKKLRASLDKRNIIHGISGAKNFEEAKQMIDETYYLFVSLDQKIPKSSEGGFEDEAYGMKIREILSKENRFIYGCILTAYPKYNYASSAVRQEYNYWCKKDFQSAEKWSEKFADKIQEFIKFDSWKKGSEALLHPLAVLTAKVYSNPTCLYRLNYFIELWKNAYPFIFFSGLNLYKNSNIYTEDTFKDIIKILTEGAVGFGQIKNSGYKECLELTWKLLYKNRQDNWKFKAWCRYVSKEVITAIKIIQSIRNTKLAHGRTPDERECEDIWKENLSAAMYLLVGCSFFARFPIVWNLSASHTTDDLYYLGQSLAGQQEVPDSIKLLRNEKPFPNSEHLYFAMNTEEHKETNFYSLYPHILAEPVKGRSRPNLWAVYQPSKAAYRNLITFEVKRFPELKSDLNKEYYL